MLDMAKRPKKSHPPGSWPIRLAAIQKRLGLTNEGMAAALEISVPTYRAWLYGWRNPSQAAERHLETFLKKNRK